MSNRIIKDTIAITVITLVAGLALGVVQDITADPIAKQEAQAKQDAYKAVFADADSFETVDVESRILKYSSLVWNILNKLFLGRKAPRGRTESAVPPLDSTLALLLRAAPGLWCGGVY